MADIRSLLLALVPLLAGATPPPAEAAEQPVTWRSDEEKVDDPRELAGGVLVEKELRWRWARGIDADTGKELWRWNNAGSGMAVLCGPTVVVILSGNQAVGLDARTGKELWKRQGMPIIPWGDTFLTMGFQSRPTEAWSGTTGANLWSEPVGLGAHQAMTPTRILFKKPGGSTLVAIDREGRKTDTTLTSVFPPAVSSPDERLVHIDMGKNTVALVEASSGKTVWTHPYKSLPRPVETTAHVLLAAADGFTLLDRGTGRVLASNPQGIPAVARFAGHPGGTFLVTNATPRTGPAAVWVRLVGNNLEVEQAALAKVTFAAARPEHFIVCVQEGGCQAIPLKKPVPATKKP